MVRVLDTVRLVVVRVLPTTRSDVTLAVEALSWPWTTTSPEAVKGEEPVTEKRLHVILVALSWPWTTSDDAILTLEANVAEPDTLRVPVALTKPDENKDEVLSCEAVNWPVILVGPWIVVAVKSGVVILPWTSNSVPTVAVFETLRLVVERDEAAVKEVKAAEVVALRVSHVKVEETETLVALNNGVVTLAVALTVWAVTRPVTDNEGTV